MQKLRIAILSYRSAKYGGGQGVYVRDISFALSLLGHDVDVISGPPYPNLHDNVKLIKLPGLDLFESFVFKDRLRKFFKKKNKSKDDFYEFFIALIGGFPEPKTFGNRIDKYLRHNVDYDVIIDNQSLSYGLLNIQKRFPLIEIIHHPITFDYKFELAASNKIRYKISRHLWYGFLKMQIKVAPKLETIITVSKSSKNGIIKEFKCNKNKIYSSSSIAIVSSLYEGFGYPVIEAMSCEVPLIATDVSSIPELVGNFAKLIKPKDSKQISDAVIEILSDYENYKVIAENGRQHIIDKFNWPKI